MTSFMDFMIRILAHYPDMLVDPSVSPVENTMWNTPQESHHVDRVSGLKSVGSHLLFVPNV